MILGAFKGLVKEQVVKQDHSFDMGDWTQIGSFPPEQYHFHQEKISEKRAQLFEDYQQPISNYGVPNTFHLSGTPMPLQPIPAATEQEMTDVQCSEIGEAKKEQPYPFFVTPFELFSNYGSRSNKAREVSVGNLSNQAQMYGWKLSTEEIMRVAGERYVRFSTQRVCNFSTSMHPYGCAMMGLSMDETKDVELVQLLLSAADKLGYQQYDRASRLLSQCEWMSSETGNPVQRIVYYFSEALRERIDRETGRVTLKRAEGGGIYGKSLVLGSSFAFLAHHQAIAFLQAIQCAGMQAILENISSATNVHLIDLQIRSGIHWIILMQALSERDKCPIRLLKITAFETTNVQDIVGTCKRLESFAQSLNLPFSITPIFLSDMKDFRAELVNIEADETVAVYSPTVLRSMLSRPDCLDGLMRAIKKLKPAIMVVNEVELSTNSPSFVKRFIEALFSYSAYFDCFEACMQQDNKNRMVLEGIYFRDGIRSLVAVDGGERIDRSVKIDVWRAFFARFGMVEVELSESSLYQARVVVNQFVCKSACHLDKNGKCLIMGWKGTPLHSLSSWKFT
ncbi:unnamed protein product [Camellia sinensis]